MKTIFDHYLNGWKNIKDNQLMRCPKLKRKEGELLLTIPYGYSFLDIGAHYGDTIITMAMLAKKNNRNDIRFFAFEPNDVKCIRIRTIAHLNNLNITIFNTCVGDINGKASIDDYTRIKKGNLLGDASYQKNPKGRLKITTLNELKDTIEPIGFIHIDTEGWETAVLQGASNILSNPINKMILVVECWDNRTALYQMYKKRSPGIISPTPEKDILEEVNKYDTIKIGTILEEEYNIFFKVNFSDKGTK